MTLIYYRCTYEDHEFFGISFKTHTGHTLPFPTFHYDSLFLFFIQTYISETFQNCAHFIEDVENRTEVYDEPYNQNQLFLFKVEFRNIN